MKTLEEILSLPDARGKHAGEECGHPQMRRLPDGTFWCPGCGSIMFEGLRAQGESNRLIAPGEEPDDDFIARQRTRLEDIRRTLLRERAGIKEEERQWDGHYAPKDAEDVGAHILAEDLDTVLDRQLVRRLGFVERALEKIEEGTYGICDATGERIPKGRLEAIYTIGARRALKT